jgi:DNA-binding response OmpR family regulator
LVGVQRRGVQYDRVSEPERNGAGLAPVPEEGGIAFSADLHGVTLFIPTSSARRPGQVLTLKLSAREGLSLRAVVRVLRCHSAGGEQGAGIDVQMLDVRALEDPLEVALTSLRPPSQQPSAETLRVLVVDDDATLRRSTADLMRAEGYEVIEAANGAEALSVALKEKVAVIVSDVQMPVVDGWQLLRLLRARAELRDVALLFHTSLNSDVERLRGYSLGVDDYVNKPAAAQDLAERVERAIARRRQPQGERAAPPLLRGDLEHVALGTLLSLLEVERRTGLLILRSEGRRAEIEIAEGRLYRARLEPDEGYENDVLRLCHVLDWCNGDFELRGAKIATSAAEGVRLSHVLLEHARTRDEQDA